MTDASHAVSSVSVSTARSVPEGATAVGYAVAASGSVPRQLGVSRSTLTDNGFHAKPGQTLAVPSNDGLLVAVGIGDADEADAGVLRRAAAAFTRAASSHDHLATNLADATSLDPTEAAQAVTEAALLASYRYVGLKGDDDVASNLTELTLLAASKRSKQVGAGIERGRTIAGAAALARELANTPPTYLNAADIARRAVDLGPDAGLEVEVFDRDDLEQMGCGGMLGVNRGSTEPPRMVKLTYTPDGADGDVAHLAMVGKGIMYDSGGISIKGNDAFHQVMKMDMSGAGAVLSAMSALRALDCPTKVTAWLMCTDNMPSGSALKLGDVLTMRNGKTVEIHNTDAEGRLVLADGLSLAVEEGVDAIVDIATLTGAALTALGPEVACLLGTNQNWIDAVSAASERVGEPTWQLPLETERYRKLLDSVVADMRNIGGPYAGTITASIFLSEFTGDVPYAHLDIAGPMKVDSDEGIYAKGATGFGTRLLIDLACSFSAPEPAPSRLA
ncbi:leucyl aminopeptidase [Ilumatobacter sp.]|uniref:leucyl aminopeptidase n=1 Tax=Ilumatobacter sp. TaxID=1967498 RepID=UPI003B5201E4